MADVQSPRGLVPLQRWDDGEVAWSRTVAICVTAWLVDALTAWTLSDNWVLTCANGNNGRDTFYLEAFIFSVPLSVLAICLLVRRLRLARAVRNARALYVCTAFALVTTLGVIGNFLVVAQLPVGDCH